MYTPYGGVIGEYNLNNYKFSWQGANGYRKTGMAWTKHYVRARHYGSVAGAWTSRDPLWPNEMPYGYVNGRTTKASDPSGMQRGLIRYPPSPAKGQKGPLFIGCGSKMAHFLKKTCCLVKHAMKDQSKINKINQCIQGLVTQGSCSPIDSNTVKCYSAWCDHGTVNCYREGKIPGHPDMGSWSGEPGCVQITPAGSPYIGPNFDKFHLQHISLPYPGEPNGVNPGLLAMSMLHEIGHKCNTWHGNDHMKNRN